MDPWDPVFPIQVRAARVLLGWTQKDLAAHAQVSVPFINRIERGERLGRAEKLGQLRNALLEAGIEAYARPDGTFGVELQGDAAMERRRGIVG